MADFTELVPDRFLPALEEALGVKLTPLIRPFPSYINRVYEVQTDDEKSYVAKFYRPGRWTKDALQDEHAFIHDCAEDEIPVVAPLTLKNGTTLGNLDGIHFAVFPKRAGRRFDIENRESWERVGVLLARLHNAGEKRRAPARLTLNPQATTRKYVDQLAESGVNPENRDKFKDVCGRIIDAISPLFEGTEAIRIHGDFHKGNILERPGEGLLLIDFDDMMTGPAVQDLWLLLPDRWPESKPTLELLLEGYGKFREFDMRSTALIEALRAMRMIYFAAWCSLQAGDAQFQARFPGYGSRAFWNQEILDLYEQYEHIIGAR